MYQAWARFKQILNDFRHQTKLMRYFLTHFSGCLDYNACVLLNSAVNGKTLEKTHEELFELLDRTKTQRANVIYNKCKNVRYATLHDHAFLTDITNPSTDECGTTSN